MYSTLYRVFFVLFPSFVLLSTAGCERKISARCAACVNGQCGAYSELESLNEAEYDSIKLYCQQFQPDQVEYCRGGMKRPQFEHKCKDEKYEWGIRFPLAPK